MGKSGSELLLYGLIIAGFLLFNFLAQKLARKAREQQAAAQAQPVEAQEELEEVWSRSPAVQPAAVYAPEPRAPARAVDPPPQPVTRPLFRTPQELRHAIVLMTVLGPCRALEPHERR